MIFSLNNMMILHSVSKSTPCVTCSWTGKASGAKGRTRECWRGTRGVLASGWKGWFRRDLKDHLLPTPQGGTLKITQFQPPIVG